MTTDQVIEHAKRIAEDMKKAASTDAFHGQFALACQFLRKFGGGYNEFLAKATRADGKYSNEYISTITASALNAFASYLASELAEDVSPTRQAQLDVVSDLLEQADTLLNTTGVHAAAPAVLIGATLEEFLRTWVENEEIDLGAKKASMGSYASLLRENDLISKEDVKDITAWAGIRNSAAHGEWSQVESKEKISLMLQGVNLFMRKYEAQ